MPRKKLDRYIMRKYLMTFFYTVLLITVVAIAMNLSEQMDKFISNKLSLKTVIMDYYIYFIPWINGELWPLFAFLSVIFFSSRMARDSEIIALLAAGVNYWRIIRPMLLAGSILAGLHWVGENYVIPPSSFHYNEFVDQYISKGTKTTLHNNIQFFINDHQKIYCKNFNTRDSTLSTFRLETFGADGHLESYLKADKLYFVRADPQPVWQAKSYEVRYFGQPEESLIVENNNPIDTSLNILPSDFILHKKQMEIMTTPDLKRYIEREKTKGISNTKSYRIEVYKRTAGPTTILILTIIGACIGTRKVRGGLGMHLAVGVAIGASYVVLSKFSETFATNLSIPIIIGVWLPNILFGLMAYYLYKRAQK